MSRFLSKKDNATSKIATVGGINASDTTFTLTTGEGSEFPASNFVVSSDNEQMLVVTRTGDVLSSITRGYGGTTAASHAQNADVELRVVKAHWDEYENVFDKDVTSSKADVILTAEQSSTPATPATGYGKFYFKNDGKLYILDDAGTETQIPTNAGNNSLYQQVLLNGNFDVWQAGTTFTTPNDDTYGADQWNFLTDGNGAWTFTQSTDVPTTGSLYSLKAENVTANKQCAIVQFIENRDAEKIIGKNVSLAFYAKTTSAQEISAIRATVLSWSSTADSITSDVIGTWAGAGTDPTFAANWTKEVAGSNKTLTTSWQRFTIENIAIDTSSTTNIAVIIWVDDTTIAAGDEFFISQIQLNEGTSALTFMPQHYEDELLKCQRFYYKKIATNAASARLMMGQATTATAAEFTMQHPVVMRGVPTVGYSNLAVLNSDASSRLAASAVAAGNGMTEHTCHVTTTHASGTTAGNATMLLSDNNTAGYLEIKAQL